MVRYRETNSGLHFATTTKNRDGVEVILQYAASWFTRQDLEQMLTALKSRERDVKGRIYSSKGGQ